MRLAPPLWVLRTAFRTAGVVAPGVAARWAESIFCRPPRHDIRATEEAFLATGARSTVRTGDLELALWRWGQGPVVLLVHGWGGRAGRFSSIAAALAAEGFGVVAFDAPAHGASAGRQASLPEFARALLDVAESLGPIHALVGHSLGGAAVSLALSQGLSAARVVLLAPPADVFIFSTAFAEHLRIPTRVRTLMHKNLQDRLQFSWEGLHLPTLARAMTLPMLLVHDRDDPDVPYAHALEIANAWAGAELVTTSGLGHRAILRNPDVVGRTVEFLKRS
ncbi:MAG TPA: alpha/beta fold hydrolase [Thermomicrobiales bacterium]|nr:alpha/beta fold hydrolase [Thermomicrobiales bacterium]